EIDQVAADGLLTNAEIHGQFCKGPAVLEAAQSVQHAERAGNLTDLTTAIHDRLAARVFAVRKMWIAGGDPRAKGFACRFGKGLWQESGSTLSTSRAG